MRILLPVSLTLALAVVVGMPIGIGVARGLIYPAEDLYASESIYPTGG